MDYATAAVIVGTIWAIGGVIIMRPVKPPANGNGNGKICGEHSGVVAKHEEIKESITKLERRMDENFKTVFDKLDRVKI